MKSSDTLKTVRKKLSSYNLKLYSGMVKLMENAMNKETPRYIDRYNINDFVEGNLKRMCFKS